MEKSNISRSIIHTISKFSDWKPKDIDALFRDKGIYADVNNWRSFIRLLLVGGGVAFLVSGIIFFFAYNWEDMHKFVKLGLVQGILTLMVLASVFLKIDTRIKNILLTGASMLIGALFAVFGQIYQTGADAYDLFLGWTLFISLWVFVSNFSPLWFIFLGLINLTIGLYAEQVAADWSPHQVVNILFLVNITSLLFLKWQEGSTLVEKVPIWLERIIVLVSIGYLTVSSILGIFTNTKPTAWFISILLTLLTYGVGIWYGQKMKDTFYIASIGLSAVMLCTFFLIRSLAESLEIGLVFLVGGFVIGSVSLLVTFIIGLNKKWHGEARVK